MSDLLKKYEESSADGVQRAREQSEGSREVNYFDLQSKYSENFSARNPGSKTIQLSNDPTVTSGHFTEDARNYYDVELNDVQEERYKRFTRDKNYLDAHKNALGSIYSSIPSE